MLKHIRPHQVLFAVPEERRHIKSLIPGPNSGGLLSLELSALLALEKLIQPKRIFEFGTYFGETAYLLALNAPESAHVWTIDLSPESLRRVRFNPMDSDLAHSVIGQTRYFARTSQLSRITQVFGDSMSFDYGQLPADFEFIFIDANHEYSYVRSDTLNAMKMVNHGWCCVIWHDYDKPEEYPGVKKYIDELAAEKELLYIEETSLVVYLEGLSVLPNLRNNPSRIIREVCREKKKRS